MEREREANGERERENLMQLGQTWANYLTGGLQWFLNVDSGPKGADEWSVLETHLIGGNIYHCAYRGENIFSPYHWEINISKALH